MESRNGTVNVLLIAIFAVGALFGITETQIMAAVPLAMMVLEIFKGDRKAVWSGNILSYIGTALVALLPWIGELWDALMPFIEGIIDGTVNNIFGALIPIATILIRLIQDKPWQNDNSGAAVAT